MNTYTHKLKYLKTTNKEFLSQDEIYSETIALKTLVQMQDRLNSIHGTASNIWGKNRTDYPGNKNNKVWKLF